MDHIEMCGRFRYSPRTSRYLSACPDLDYFRLADNLGDIAWWPDCLRRGSDYARERAITRVMSSCCSLPLLGSGLSTSDDPARSAQASPEPYDLLGIPQHVSGCPDPRAPMSCLALAW